MSYRIIGLGRTLPTEFIDLVGTAMTELPRDAYVGDVIISKFGAWRLAKIGTGGLDEALLGQATITTTASEITCHEDAARGDNFVNLRLAAVTKDSYKGGRLFVTDSVGMGHEYPISSNSVASGSNHNFQVMLSEPLRTDFATTTKVRLISNPYSNVVEGTAGGAEKVGWAGLDLAATNYGFLKFGGFVVAQTGAPLTLHGPALVAHAGGTVNSNLAATVLPHVGTIVSPLSGNIANNARIVIKATLGRWML